MVSKVSILVLVYLMTLFAYKMIEIAFFKQDNREGAQRVSSITSSYPGPSHTVRMTSSISSDEDMLDIATTGPPQAIFQSNTFS